MFLQAHHATVISLRAHNRGKHIQNSDQNSRTGRRVLTYHMEHGIEQSHHTGCSERPAPAGRPAIKTPVGRYNGTISHNAAPSRSSALIAVWGSLMPGDRARTATSTSCRTANSRSAELTRCGPNAVASSDRRGTPLPPEAPSSRPLRREKYSRPGRTNSLIEVVMLRPPNRRALGHPVLQITAP